MTILEVLKECERYILEDRFGWNTAEEVELVKKIRAAIEEAEKEQP